jgi:hypothetical protein
MNTFSIFLFAHDVKLNKRCIFVALKLQILAKRMKNATERNAEIFNMWANNHMSFQEISTQSMPSFYSLKYIRNIIYGGRSRLKSEFEKDIYRIFRLKFLELQNINASIYFVYENQPSDFVSERTVRRIITDELKKKNKKHTCQ